MQTDRIVGGGGIDLVSSGVSRLRYHHCAWNMRDPRCQDQIAGTPSLMPSRVDCKKKDSP
jgi:hypothetical protein